MQMHNFFRLIYTYKPTHGFLPVCLAYLRILIQYNTTRKELLTYTNQLSYYFYKQLNLFNKGIEPNSSYHNYLKGKKPMKTRTHSVKITRLLTYIDCNFLEVEHN